MSMLNPKKDVLLLIHVHSPVTFYDAATAPEQDLAHWQELKATGETATEERRWELESQRDRRSRAILQHYGRLAGEQGTQAHLLDVLAADPAEAICDLVEEKQADFLVMGHREIHPLKRFILGSVAEFCSRHAACTVVVAREEVGPAESHVPRKFVTILEERFNGQEAQLPMPLAPETLKAREERLNDEAFRLAEQGRLSRLNRQVTALQEAEEQRRLQDNPKYAPLTDQRQLRENAHRVANVVACAESLNLPSDRPAIELLHHHSWVL